VRLADLVLESVDRVLVARIEGEIDLSNATDIGAQIGERMPNDALGVVLDLASVNYLDSAGIRLLFELRERVGRRGQELRLAIPPGASILRTLEIVDVPNAIAVFESVDAALRSIPGLRDGGD
jgi:anti-anti-sigma factor